MVRRTLVADAHVEGGGQMPGTEGPPRQVKLKCDDPHQRPATDRLSSSRPARSKCQPLSSTASSSMSSGWRPASDDFVQLDDLVISKLPARGVRREAKQLRVKLAQHFASPHKKSPGERQFCDARVTHSLENLAGFENSSGFRFAVVCTRASSAATRAARDSFSLRAFAAIALTAWRTPPAARDSCRPRGFSIRWRTNVSISLPQALCSAGRICKTTAPCRRERGCRSAPWCWSPCSGPIWRGKGRIDEQPTANARK